MSELKGLKVAELTLSKPFNKQKMNIKLDYYIYKNDFHVW